MRILILIDEDKKQIKKFAKYDNVVYNLDKMFPKAVSCLALTIELFYRKDAEEVSNVYDNLMDQKIRCVSDQFLENSFEILWAAMRENKKKEN